MRPRGFAVRNVGWGRHAAGLLLVVGLALALRLWTVHGPGFDGLYGQDSFAYYYHGLALWRDHALSYHWPWLPAPTRLFWPLGYPTLLAAAFAATGHPSVALAQAVTLAAGLVVVSLTYLLTLRAVRPALPPLPAHLAALLAGALIAGSGLQVQASVTLMSDAPALAWGMAAIWCWTAPSHSRLASFLGGACLALAVSTRYEYVALVPALVVYWWLERHPRSTRYDGRGRSIPSLPAGLIGTLIAGLPQLLYNVSYSAPVLGHQWLTGWSIAHVWQANFRTVDGSQHYSHTVGAFYFIRPLLAPESLPWLLAPFALAGALALALHTANCIDRSDSDQPGPLRLEAPPFMAGSLICPPSRGLQAARSVGQRRPSAPREGKRPKDRASRANEAPRPEGRGFTTAAAHSDGLRPLVPVPAWPWDKHPGAGMPLDMAFPLLLLIWWLIPTLYLAGVPFESARFALIAQPPLAMAEAVGLIWAARLLAVLAPSYRTLIHAVAVLWGAGSLTVLVGAARAPADTLIQGKASDLRAVAWLSAHAPSGSSITTFGLTLTLYHYGDPADRRWRLYDLSALDNADWDRLARVPHLLVVANVGNLVHQWTGQPPDQAFRRLVNERRLTPVAAAGVYTVYG